MLLEINDKKQNESEYQTKFLSMEDIEMRIANYLLDLSKLSGSLYFEFPMKFKDFTSFISKAPETVSRKLKLLEDAQLIERDVKVIKILDKERLENIFE